MEEAFLIEKLLLFGLGRQEALIYLCLLENGALTGYEAAKLTGISRSNVYNGLAALVEHGAAYVLEGAATKYLAVELGEFCHNRISYLEKEKEELLRNAPCPKAAPEGYVTIAGYHHICNKIGHMLSEAAQRVYISAGSVFLEKWSRDIEALLARGIKVVILSDKVPEGLKQAGGSFSFYRTLPLERQWEDEREREERERQLRLIIDSAYVLTGQIAGRRDAGSRDDSTCLYSAQRNFVNVFKEAMSNEIRLIEILQEKA